MRLALITAAIILGIFAVVYQGWEMFAGPSRQPMLQGNDDSYYYFWLRSAVVDGDLDFTNELLESPTLDAQLGAGLLAESLTPAGRPPNKYPIGWALATTPFFLIAHGLALLTNLPADGWQPVYFVFIWAGHLGLTVLGLWLAARVLRRFVGAESAWIGVLAGWLVSPLLYYQTARISMVHGLAFVLTVAVFELAFQLKENAGSRLRWGLFGGVAALLVLTRPTSVVYLLFPAWVVIGLLHATPSRRQTLHGLGWAALPACALIGLQSAAWHQVYGSWWPDTYAGETFHFTSPQLLSVLFSPQHGLFYCHPLLLPAGGAFFYATMRRVFPLSWLLSLLLITTLNASWWCWWFGSSFGNRAFEGAIFFFMAGLAFLWERSYARALPRRCFIGILATAIILNIVFLLLFMTGSISRLDPVSYQDMLAVVRHLRNPF